ncbi:MAG: hypothetical protein RJB66_1084 [Pseudomonadota bacterium]|jgi:flagellar L-ring protein precursor FlgH
MNYLYALIGISFLLMGCETLGPMFDTSPNPPDNASRQPVEAIKKDPVRFSENPNIGAFNERRYRRMTRKSLEEESDVGSRAGSLWNTEGPSSYLFTQNKLHREGDLLTVKMEGNAKTQIDSKIQVIKKLLARLDIVAPQPGSASGAPLAANSPRDPASEATSPQPNQGNGEKAIPPANAPSTGSGVVSKQADPSEEADIPINLETVPTRVSERMGDGNYRVKGQQSFMIGKKEFRVIVTGLVRPEDFSDEGISSNKLLDPQIDVVSLRRSLQ